jgi:AcrR family transcriptional regulator
MPRSKRSSERQRGRPAEAAGQDLRTRILDEAETLFATHGFSATPVRRIADAAGVNPALVHYYFGDKKSLLGAVMQRATAPLIAAIASMRGDPETGPEAIASLLISMAARRPNLPRLVAREVLLPGGEMQQVFVEKMAPQLGGALPPLLARAQSTGRVRRDADPAIATMMIMGLCLFPFIARDLAEPVLGVRFDETSIETLTREVTQLLQRGLTT